MKKTKTIYWIVTILFAGFMIFSAIPDIMMVPEAVKMISTDLGYPKYIIPFLGVAKLLGAIILVSPGFPRLKEWAYAGMFIDLVGAVYSVASVFGFQAQMLFMVLPFGFLFLSYFLYHKKMAGKEPVILT